MLGHVDRYGERRRPGQHRLLLASDGVYGFMHFRLCCCFIYLSARETTATAYSMFSGNKIFQSELMRRMS